MTDSNVVAAPRLLSRSHREAGSIRKRRARQVMTVVVRRKPIAPLETVPENDTAPVHRVAPSAHKPLPLMAANLLCSDFHSSSFEEHMHLVTVRKRQRKRA